jgi:hypothetical protein
LRQPLDDALNDVLRVPARLEALTEAGTRHLPAGEETEGRPVRRFPGVFGIGRY